MKLSRSSGRLTKPLRSERGQLSRSHHDQARRTGVSTVMGAIWIRRHRVEDEREHVTVRAPADQHVEVAVAGEREDRWSPGCMRSKCS